MANYNSDKSFTDYVHDHLAVPLIYPQLGWKPSNVTNSYTDERDRQDGIDYQAVDANGFKITIQERFRDEFYKNYNDFTIRYTREKSLRPGEKKSEFFKIDASYFIYGITNGKKFLDKRHTLTDFVKYIVFDVNSLKNLFRNGKIKIPDHYVSSSQVKLVNGEKTLFTAKKANTDGSSEFIAIDPMKLKDVLGDQINSAVVLQKGFYAEPIPYNLESYKAKLPRVAEDFSGYE